MTRARTICTSASVAQSGVKSKRQLVDQYFSRRYFLIGTTAGITELLVFRHAIGQVRQGAKAARTVGQTTEPSTKLPARNSTPSSSPSDLPVVNLWDGLSGVTGRYCNFGARLPWRNPGGDWLDATGVAQGFWPRHRQLHHTRYLVLRHHGARSPLVRGWQCRRVHSGEGQRRNDRPTGKHRSRARTEAHARAPGRLIARRSMYGERHYQPEHVQRSDRADSDTCDRRQHGVAVCTAEADTAVFARNTVTGFG